MGCTTHSDVIMPLDMMGEWVPADQVAESTCGNSVVCFGSWKGTKANIRISVEEI